LTKDFILGFPEISHHCPTAKIILVGTKLDLKNDSTVINDLRRTNQLVVSTDEAEVLRKEIKAQCYIGIYLAICLFSIYIFNYLLIKIKECSAKTRENLKKVFDQAISCCLERKPRTLKCNLL
jgi:GTPase SAR1 family protein